MQFVEKGIWFSFAIKQPWINYSIPFVFQDLRLLFFVGFLSHYNKLTICSVEELSSFQSEIHPPTQVPHHVHTPIRGHPLHIEAVSGDWVKVTPSQ